MLRCAAARAAVTAAAFAVATALFVAGLVLAPRPAVAAEPAGGAGGLMVLAMAGQPIEETVGGFTKTLFREVRRSFRQLRWMFWRAVGWWSFWLRRAAFPIAVVIVAALADGALIAAWKAEGLRPLLTYSTLMLYVYGRLLFSRGVSLAPKLLLLGALIYGAIRRDLLPDRSFWPGRVEDVLLLVIATRTFVYACPQELVNEYAERAVRLKRRLAGAR